MPLPVISTAQMRAWEKATWATGQTAAAVIQSVGRQLAGRILALTPPGAGLLLLAGKGNNGEDVRAAVPHLTERQVVLIDVQNPAASRSAVAAALTYHPALIVDGLFGIGLNRPLEADWQELIGLVNASGRPVLAVDVPSGLQGDTGEPAGAAIRADWTLTIGAPKAGLLQPASWEWAGRVEVVTGVGLIPCPSAAELNWSLPEDFIALPPRRPVAGHKGSFGHVAIVAGSLGYHGAAVLAARGALRAQPGLISVFTQENIYLPVAAQLQGPMVQPWLTGNDDLPGDFDALLAGPGLAAQDLPASIFHQICQWWQQAPMPMVGDASVLTQLPSGAIPAESIRVITPHPGEAARLLGSTPAAVQRDRTGAVRALSQRLGGCWVVLKGHHTLIGRTTGAIFVNPSGNPHLAQGGAGDLLAGYLAGLLAQPAWREDVATTLRYAVWQHGAAADRLQARDRHWTVEDLADELGNA
ncbi:MAG TPA: NAD(P)H-hydrate dehydratase [Verrucomicrobiae bacterium]